MRCFSRSFWACDDRFLLGLQLDARAQGVDVRRETGSFLVSRQLVERLRGLHFGLVASRRDSWAITSR